VNLQHLKTKWNARQKATQLKPLAEFLYYFKVYHTPQQVTTYQVTRKLLDFFAAKRCLYF